LKYTASISLKQALTGVTVIVFTNLTVEDSRRAGVETEEMEEGED
jgi:hypothetical protein